jgi:hypothetical protein
MVRGHPEMRLLLPFIRTAANVFEGSLERTPGVGWLVRNFYENPVPFSQMLAEQGLGGIVATMAYQMGQEVDPESSAGYKLPMVIANMTGQYGALAAAAFAAGQASYKGDPGLKAAFKGANRFWQDLPLPTTETIAETHGNLENYLEEGMANPNAIYPPQQYLPDAIRPKILDDNWVEMVRNLTNNPRERSLADLLFEGTP